MKPTKATPPDRPPRNTLRVMAWRDLPQERRPARYTVTREDGRKKVITVQKGYRVVLDALLKQPVFCASPVRISECVNILRRDYGVPIEARMFENDAATDRARFGVYFLGDGVSKIEAGKL